MAQKLSRKVVRKVVRAGIAVHLYTRTMQARQNLGAWLRDRTPMLVVNVARASRELQSLSQITKS